MTAVLYTIGHSNYAFEDFVALLAQQKIEVVVDVRSNPYSRYATYFTGSALKPLLHEAGYKYLFLGKEIGGKPTDPRFLDEEGYVDYSLVAQSELFQGGMNRLETGVQKYRVAAMCGEENPTGCHRRNLIAKEAARRGIEVIHIRKGGILNTEEDLLFEENGPPPEATQLTLFGNEPRYL